MLKHQKKKESFASIILEGSTKEIISDCEESICSFKEPSTCTENFTPTKTSVELPLNRPSKKMYIFLEHLEINADKNQKYIEKPFKIQKFLIEFFIGKTIEIEDLKFDLFELEIINLFFMYKFKKIKKIRQLKFDKKDLFAYKKSLFKLIKIASNHISTKRKEENNKFIYKFVLKILKLKFQKNQKKQKENENKEFYTYYFGEYAKQQKQQLEDYTDPLNKKGTKSSINSNFLKRIFLVKKFKKDFENILLNQFQDFYHSSITTKINRILKIYYQNIKTETKKETYSNFLKFISKKGIKFPWFHMEINNAMFQLKEECLKTEIKKDLM